MLPVSAEWQVASRGQFRYQAYLHASLELTPPTLRKNAVVTSVNTFSQSDIHSIMDTVYDPPTKYITLERNRWLLNGEFQALPENVVTEDWWSEDSSSVVIHFQFDKVYSIPGLYVYWDLENETFPEKITARGYDLNGALSTTVVVNNINSTYGYYEYPMDDIKSVDLIIEEWNIPGWRKRISEFLFGLFIEFSSVNNGRIMSASATDSASPISEELPVRDMSLVLRNLDGYFNPTMSNSVSKYLAARQVFYIKWGFNVSYNNTEWTEELPYFIKDFSIPADSKNAQINLTSRLAFLTNDYLYGLYTKSNRTLYDIATEVLENSNVINEHEQENPWVLPDFLKNYVTNAPIAGFATNVILQYIALASCSWLCLDALTGYITYKKSHDTVSEYCRVDQSQTLGDPSIEVEDRLRSITIILYKYGVKSESQEIGDGDYVINGTQTINIKYTSSYADAVQASVTGGTLKSAEYYASYAILTVTSNNSTTPVNIKLTGKPIEATKTFIETFKDPKVEEGINVEVDNPFITDSTKLNEISEYIKKYHDKRLKYKGEYLGYPQMEPSDRVEVETVYGEGNMEITRNSIQFNGAWQGTFEGV